MITARATRRPGREDAQLAGSAHAEMQGGTRPTNLVARTDRRAAAR
jgi:hypothetical protein